MPQTPVTQEDPRIMAAAKMHLLLVARMQNGGTKKNPLCHVKNLKPGDFALLIHLLHGIHQLDNDEMGAIDFEPDATGRRKP